MGIEELRLLYLSQSEDKISHLRDTLDKIENGSTDSIDNLYWRFHNMVGSGGSYGFPYVTEISERASNILKPFMQHKKIPSPQAIKEVLQIIEILELYFKKALAAKGEFLPEEMLEYRSQGDSVSGMLPKTHNEYEPPPNTVLAVDSDEASLRLINWALGKENIEVWRIHEVHEALRLMTVERPDVVITEMKLRDSSGLDFVGKLRSDQVFRTLPVLVVASDPTLKDRIDAMAAGANQFFSKPFNPLVIAASVKAEIKRTAQIQEFTIYDSLTGAYSRRYIFERIREEIFKHQRSMEPLCMAIIDIDLFKNVNDTYGHLAGDEVLRRLITFLRDNFRMTDIIGRYGGEEFIVLMPNTTRNEAISILDRIRSKWAGTRHTLGGKKESVKITFSAGVAVLESPGLQAEDLLFRADRALYCAKDLGRNRVCSEES